MFFATKDNSILEELDGQHISIHPSDGMIDVYLFYSLLQYVNNSTSPPSPRPNPRSRELLEKLSKESPDSSYLALACQRKSYI
jgi:hypothetical protein